VTTEERTYVKQLPLQRGIFGIFGLVMATSSCPYMDFLKPMARFHLPFSTAEETIVRSVSMYLLRQYFVAKRGEQPDLGLEHLETHYENIQKVNDGILDRIKGVVENDADLNALIILQGFADLLTMAISKDLSKIEPLFFRWGGGGGDRPPPRHDFPEYFAAQRPAAGVGRRQCYCIGPLQYTGQAAVQTDIATLQTAMVGVQAAEAFLPAVAVGTVEHWIANEYYPSDEAFLFALADALHEEYRAIVEAGFLLQLDNPNLPDGFGLYTHLDVPAYRTFQELRIAALNRSIAGLPASRIRMHVCWGAHKGPHNTDIPLKDIVDLMLDVQVEAYSMEAANPRHAHEWHLWEHVKLPAGKILIPGVVGHGSDTIEPPELVAERLCNHASVVGRDNVIAGTDCDFGTSRLHPTIAHLKLQTLVEGARLASQKLWGL
jgi:5-methyltetrahydropteroyltriglutamate--homocysteine methyltransferase